MSAQGGGDHSQELLPVVGVHMELLGVHNTQVGVGVLDVVHVLHSGFQSTHHGLSVVGHLSVSTNGGIGGEVSETSEVSLGPGIHNQNADGLPDQGLRSDLSHINLSPQAGDGTSDGFERCLMGPSCVFYNSVRTF
uniref:Uncharacterized protein n=1 Tax=Kryptolebias marmoratus TaxID=37003 RepID=A0A3Q3B5I8_KRYMA